MKRAPLIIAPGAIDPPRIVLDGQDAQHAVRVLRLRVGSPLRVSNGVDTIYQAETTVIGRDRLEARVLSTQPLAAPERPRIEVIQVLPKPQLAERILAPCTTLGVAAFHFVPGRRTPLVLSEDVLAKRQERWQGIVRAAAAQSEIGRVPVLRCYASLKACLAQTAADLRFVADEALGGAMGGGVMEALRAHQSPRLVQWLIGPEGGFDPEERALCEEFGITPVSLGPHILRLETAAVAAIVITRAFV